MEQPVSPTTPAASSPAAPSPASAQTVLDGLSREQRSHWELTGEFPTQTPSADSSPAKPVEQAAETAASSPASEPGKPADPKEKGVKARSAELDRDIAAMQDKLRLRAQLRDELARTERPSDGKPDSSPGQPPTQAEWKRFLAMPDAPKVEDFEGENGFVEWTAAVGLFIADKRYQEHQDRARGDSEFRSQVDAVTRLQEEATARVSQYAKDHPDFNTKVHPELIELDTATVRRLKGQKVGPQHVLAEEILKSPSTAQLLEHFSTEAGQQEWARLMTLAPGDLMRAFGRIEGRMEQGTSQAPPAASAPAPKDLSSAPPPGKPMGERPTEPIDPSEAALKRRDYRAFEAAENAREMAALAGR
jgi:hypothetical protein